MPPSKLFSFYFNRLSIFSRYFLNSTISAVGFLLTGNLYSGDWKKRHFEGQKSLILIE